MARTGPTMLGEIEKDEKLLPDEVDYKQPDGDLMDGDITVGRGENDGYEQQEGDEHPTYHGERDSTGIT